MNSPRRVVIFGEGLLIPRARPCKILLLGSDILLPCLWDGCRCAPCIALEATRARDDTRFMEIHYDELKNLAESLFARTADVVTGRMDVWARSMDPKWGKREVLHDLLSAEQGSNAQICDILAMERRAERAAGTLVAGDAGDGTTAMDGGDAAGSGADDDDGAAAAALHAAQAGKAGKIEPREADDLRNGTPLGRHTADAYEVTREFGRQGAQFADAHGPTGADAARAPDDDATSALLVHFNGDRNLAIKELRKKQKQHLHSARDDMNAADERTQAALANVALGKATLTRTLLAPAEGDLSIDSTMRALFAAVDEGPIPNKIVEQFGFPTACVYGPLAKIGYGNIYDSDFRTSVYSQCFCSVPGPSSRPSWTDGPARISVRCWYYSVPCFRERPVRSPAPPRQPAWR